jgi:hypothetical protein
VRQLPAAPAKTRLTLRQSEYMSGVPAKRGRKRKADAPPVPVDESGQPAKKKRGRKPKNADAAAPVAGDVTTASTADADAAPKVIRRRRGPNKDAPIIDAIEVGDYLPHRVVVFVLGAHEMKIGFASSVEPVAVRSVVAWLRAAPSATTSTSTTSPSALTDDDAAHVSRCCFTPGDDSHTENCFGQVAR